MLFVEIIFFIFNNTSTSSIISIISADENCKPACQWTLKTSSQ